MYTRASIDHAMYLASPQIVGREFSGEFSCILVFLPGLEDVVADEVADRLPTARRSRLVPGRDDSIAVSLSGSLRPLFRLRTIVAPLLVLSFPVPRPKSLLSGEYFPAIVDAVRQVEMLNPGNRPQNSR